MDEFLATRTDTGAPVPDATDLEGGLTAEELVGLLSTGAICSDGSDPHAEAVAAALAGIVRPEDVAEASALVMSVLRASEAARAEIAALVERDTRAQAEVVDALKRAAVSLAPSPGSPGALPEVE